MSRMPPPPPPGYPTPPPPGFPPQQPPMGYPPPGMGQYAPLPSPQGNGAAVGSLICGLIGCVPYVTSLLAVILGIIGIRKTRHPGVGGRGMAITGLILGLLGIIGWIIATAAFGGAWALYSASKPARAEALNFAKELSNGQVDAAMARCTNSVKRADLDAASKQLMPIGIVVDTTFPVFSYQNNGGVEQVDLTGVAQFGGQNAVPYIVHLVKVNGTFKIDRFDFQTAQGAPSPGAPPSPSSAPASGDSSSDSDPTEKSSGNP